MAKPGRKRERAARRRRRRVEIVGLTVLMVLGLLPVSVALATPASALSTGTCPGTKAAPSLIPAWSDASGWTHADQFRTILSGDLDGDGVGELIGRNASNIEIYTWAGPSTATGKAYNPGLGQWTQILPNATPPSFATADGWWDPSTSSTFRLADLDGKPGEELLVRNTGGVQIYAYDKTAQTFVGKSNTGLFTDAGGWGQTHPEYWSTIMTGNVDGKPGDEIIARGHFGIEAYTLNGDLTSTPQRVDQNPIFADGTGWTDPKYYSTIQVGDMNGDQRDDIIARGVDGLEVWTLTAGGIWSELGVLGDWTGTSWDEPEYYKTIFAADVNGDGKDDALARTSSGMDARTLLPGGTWQAVAAIGGFTDGSGFQNPEAYETIQAADVIPSAAGEHPKSELIGRGWDGLYTIAVENGVWVQKGPQIAQFSDANGWGTYATPPQDTFDPSATPPDYRYATIQPVTVHTGEPQLIIGRDASGVRTVGWDGSSPTSAFAPYTDMRVSTSPSTNISFKPGTDLDPLGDDQYKRAYWYLNSFAVQNGWWNDGTTILDVYDDLSNQAGVTNLNGKLTTDDPLLPGETQAVNVPRDVFDGVQADVRDWNNAQIRYHDHIYGPNGVIALTTTAYTVNETDVNNIAGNFTGDSALVALLGDLLWGLLGALGALVGAIPGLQAATIAIWSAIGGLIGSGVAAGVGFADPDGSTNSQAAQLATDMANSFQCAITFLGTSFDQTVKDYGLLMANDRVLSQQTLNGTTYSQLLNKMIDAKRLWIWQQFGNRDFGENFWLGVCDFGRGVDCAWDKGADYTWAPPEDPNISYRLIGKLDGSQNGYCEYSVLTDGNADLKKLFDGTTPAGVPAAKGLDLISPRNTEVVPLGWPQFVSEVGSGGKGRTGILGWHLPRWKCDVGGYYP